MSYHFLANDSETNLHILVTTFLIFVGLFDRKLTIPFLFYLVKHFFKLFYYYRQIVSTNQMYFYDTN